MGGARDPLGCSVALLSPCFWPEVRRGSERFVRDLADGLLARGLRPSLITSHPGAPHYAVEDRLPVLRLPRPPQGRLLRRGYPPYLTHLPLSYAALRAGSYQLAHAVYPTDALAAASWGKRTGRPAVLSFMGVPDRQGLCEHRRQLDIMLRAVEGCDAVVALSDHAADAFRYWLGYEPRVIHPGVDLGAFRPASARAGRPTIVCSAAPEVPRKHVPLLIDAFQRVRRELPDARLVLSRPSDPAAARKAGVPQRAPGVEFVNLDDRRALARAYSEAWIVVLPSAHEAFGLILIEALACGTPVVGYADGGIPEILDRPGIGTLFHELRADSLASAMLEGLELSADPAVAERCRARAEELSTDRCVERYVDLYGELLGIEGRDLQPAANPVSAVV